MRSTLQAPGQPGTSWDEAEAGAAVLTESSGGVPTELTMPASISFYFPFPGLRTLLGFPWVPLWPHVFIFPSHWLPFCVHLLKYLFLMSRNFLV